MKTLTWGARESTGPTCRTDAMFSLRPAVRACLDQGAVVFLDLRRDRYFAVEHGRAPEIVGVCDGGDGAAAPSLLARNLIEPFAGAPMPPEQGRSALMGELDPQAYLTATVTASDWTRMLYACARAAYALRRRRLDLTFDSLEGCVSKPARASAPTSDATAKFELMRPWYPYRRVCLFDSLALMHFLLAAGRSPRLVMGVRARPFSAHCWVEEDGVCLNDAAETCRSYAQIACAG